MSITTLAAASPAGDSIRPDAYHAGRAAARDEHADGATLDVLKVRLNWTTEYADGADAISYALGYGAQIAALLLNATAWTTA